MPKTAKTKPALALVTDNTASASLNINASLGSEAEIETAIPAAFEAHEADPKAFIAGIRADEAKVFALADAKASSKRKLARLAGSICLRLKIWAYVHDFDLDGHGGSWTLTHARLPVAFPATRDMGEVIGNLEELEKLAKLPEKRQMNRMIKLAHQGRLMVLSEPQRAPKAKARRA